MEVVVCLVLIMLGDCDEALAVVTVMYSVLLDCEEDSLVYNCMYLAVVGNMTDIVVSSVWPVA